MNADLANFFARHARDARYAPRPKPRLCAACREPGEFDDMRVVYPSEHHEQFATQFGGDGCLNCLDVWAPCEWCGQLTDERSTDHYCSDCEDWINRGADRPAWK